MRPQPLNVTHHPQLMVDITNNQTAAAQRNMVTPSGRHQAIRNPTTQYHRNQVPYSIHEEF